MNRLLCLALCLAATSGMAATVSADAAPIRLSIAAGKVGEVCMALGAGDTLAWRFRASAPTDFNLHQHVGDKVLTPVSRQAMTRSRARHTVDRDNDWCLMWTAPPGQAVTVSGDWQVRRARKR
jgi:hypothetical protein